MTKTTNQKQFSTFDLGLTGALLTHGFRLLSLNKTNPKKVSFNFEHEEGLDQAVEDYFSSNFQVDAQTYFNHIKSLKNRIYSN